MAGAGGAGGASNIFIHPRPPRSAASQAERCRGSEEKEKLSPTQSRGKVTPCFFRREGGAMICCMCLLIFRHFHIEAADDRRQYAFTWKNSAFLSLLQLATLLAYQSGDNVSSSCVEHILVVVLIGLHFPVFRFLQIRFLLISADFRTLASFKLQCCLIST